MAVATPGVVAQRAADTASDASSPEAASAGVRRALTHADYDRWPSIRGSALSPSGEWLAYEVRPAVGDGELRIRSLDGGTEYRHPRGSGPKFSKDNRFVVFSVRPSFREARQKKIAQLTAQKTGSSSRSSASRSSSSPPASALAILSLANGSVEVIERIKTWRMDKHGECLLYQVTPKKEPTKKTAAKKAPAKKPAPKTEPAKGAVGEAKSKTAKAKPAKAAAAAKAKKKAGTPLVCRKLASGGETHYSGVLGFSLVADDEWLCVHTAQPEKKKAEKAGAEDSTVRLVDGLHAVRMRTGRHVLLQAGEGSFSGFTTDPRHTRLAFSSDVADRAKRKAKKEAAKKEAAKEAEASKGKAGKKKAGAAAARVATATPDDKTDPVRRAIYVWDFGDGQARRVAYDGMAGLPAKTRVQSSVFRFTDDASKLTFRIKDDPLPPPRKLLSEDTVAVDIWHWQDGLIQPMQAKRQSMLVNPSRTCVVALASGSKAVVLGTERMPSVSVLGNGDVAVGSDGFDYLREITWDGRYADVYVIDPKTGERECIVKHLRSRPRWSPSGRFVLWFGGDRRWHAFDTNTKARHDLTGSLEVQFDNELEDRPQPASAYGIAGWLSGERGVVLYDRYDLWHIPLPTGKPKCLTAGFGRKNQLEFRYQRFDFEGDDEKLDPLQRRYLPEKLLLATRSDATQARGFSVCSSTKAAAPKQLILDNCAFGSPQRAKNADRVVLSRSTFADFPDLWTADLSFQGMRKLTDACPEQRDVRWGKAELVHWTNDDGVELQGLLMKPDGFDPKKKYPMMVYFYERNARNLHRYTSPRPGTSPNASYYVSNGYLWFVPDIVYTVGYPGESAEKCVISGVQSLVANGYVDEARIGIAGHSWGGYQTAHLVTRTKMFAAAESGAPVSNMFSAYGGIRYDSGMSRQFQYEKTQSRIGGTPWEMPDRYRENSPIFHADRVTTPVLLLHNDKDGAVPWTNGIEFFMALRRLDREAYFFNYNGEPHGLRKRQNQKDWTRRMAEFFDHHLKGKPAAAWMKNGVPYAERMREKTKHAPRYWREI